MEALKQAQFYKRKYEDAQRLLCGGINSIPSSFLGSTANTDVSASALALQALAITCSTTKMSLKHHKIEISKNVPEYTIKAFFSTS